MSSEKEEETPSFEDNIKTLVEHLNKNKEEGTVINSDEAEIGNRNDQKEPSVVIDFICNRLHLIQRLELDNEGINLFCQTLREKQGMLLEQNKIDRHIISNDERIDFGMHTMNADNFAVVNNKDKKHVGILTINNKIRHALIFSMEAKEVKELIETLQKSLLTLEKQK